MRQISRPRHLALLGLTAAVVVTLVTPAAATPPDPATPTAATTSTTSATPQPDTVSSALAQLRTIGQQNEQLSEQLNLTTADVAAKQKALADAQTAAATASAEFARQRAALAANFAVEYESGSTFGRTGALLNSGSDSAYADKLTTLSLLSARSTAMLTSVAAANGAATKAQAAADSLLAEASAKQDELKDQQSTLAGDLKKYDALLSSLTAQQRTAYLSYGEVSQDISKYLLHTGPIAAQVAVNFALAQVGKPYVFAAAGPTAYDCSGLTMAAWAAAGVALPHYAATQYDYGTHVAEADLQPGDLIFMYHPIDHVTIYIGNGLMVSAPEPGDHVKIVTVASEQDIYVGATRLF